MLYSDQMAHISFRSFIARISAASLLSGTLALTATSAARASVSTDAKVAIGWQHVVALGSNGTVWTWGSLVPGSTGVGSKDALATPTQVTLSGGRTAVDVAATSNASFAVASDGTVWGWGSLGRGLGDAGNTTDVRYTTPVQVVFGAGINIVEVSAACEGVMARASNGDVYQWGNFYGNWQMSYARPTKVDGITGATSIERGCNSSFAVLSNGTAMAWGSNGGGRLGDGTTTDRATPVSISLPNSKSFARISTSSSHSLGLATDGSVFAWGGNSNGQLASDPNALSYQATPRAIAIGSTTAVAVAASDSSPFSTVVTAASTVLKWGGWGTSEYVPSALTLPTADLGNRTLRDVTTFQGAMFVIANDQSLWAKGWWSSADLDGNCGANASDWPMWKDGITYAPRPLVRTISQGQFGSAFTEDQISIARLETGSGTVLPLDGTGNALGSVNTEMTIIATSPRSSCYTPDRLTYEFSDNNGSSWVSTGITTSTNSFAQTVVTIAYTPSTSGRKRAQIRITNPDGKSTTYRLNIGVAASSGGGGVVTPSALPIVATASGVSLAIGSNKFLYAWGAATTITGQVDAVKEPVRVTPAVDTSQTFRDVAVAKRSADSYAAAAVSEDGKLYVWGNASPDVFVGGTSAVTAPTLLAMPAGKRALRVVIGASSFCTSSCTAGLFGVVLDEDGNVYAFGGGPQDSGGGQGKFGASVIAVPSLAGSAFSSIVNAPQYGSNVSSTFFLRQASGDLYMWTANKVCSGSCSSWAAPIAISNVSAKITPGRLSGRDYQEFGVLEITASNVLQYIPINSQNGSVGTTVSLSLPGGRTAVQATPGEWSGFSVLASDGTIWNLYSASQPAWRVNLPVEALPVSRLASRDGVYLIGAGGSMWAMDGWDSEESGRFTGTCAETNRDSGNTAVRTTSTGQFGPAYSQDSFWTAFDSPRYVWYNHPTQPLHVEQPRIPSWARQINVRPNASTRLYTYFKSSCTGTTGLSVEWDLDDDGTFETSGTVGSVTSGTTSLTTPILDPNPEEQWDGISLTEFKESYVDITSSSPGGVMNQGGGRFISVKYSSSRGTFTEKFAVVVQPKKPDGRVGVTVNAGARFTDNSEVTLGLVWPEGMTTAVISNDGSFSDAQQVPLAPTVRWTLPSTGSGFLSSVVYVRFESLYVNSEGGWYNNADGDSYIQQFTDDIVLDLSPPEVTSVSATSNSPAQSQRVGVARSASSSSTALVSFSALDAVSGVSAVQITSDPAVPGPERAYSRQYSIPVDRGSIAIRAKDNVGHWSPWTYARIADFVAPAPAPQNPTPVTPAPQSPAPTPVVPAPAPVTQAPSVPTPAPAAGTGAISAPSAKAVLSGTTAKVSVSVPASLAKTCTTKTVKGKKTTTCVTAQITVSVSGGATKKVNARSGNNSISMPKVKKGQTITVKVGSKVISRIKLK